VNILGLNAYHGDSAACLVKDGKLIAAAEEERFRRVKHWAGFPSDAILYCLSEGSVSLEEVDAIAINSDPRANLGRKVVYALRTRPSVSFLLSRLANIKRRMFVNIPCRKIQRKSFFYRTPQGAFGVLFFSVPF